MRLHIFCLLNLLCGLSVSKAADLSALWQDRVKTTVGVEFFIEGELGRQRAETMGVVIDEAGTIIFPAQVVSNRVTPEQLKDFRVYLPGEPAENYFSAEYLGPDEFTGWQFIRVEAKARTKLIPITRYAATAQTEPAIAEELWGVGLRKKAEDFTPYYLGGRVAIVQSLPQRTAVLTQDVAGQGLPVFNGAGDFMGLAVGGYGQTFLQFTARNQTGMPVVMVNPDESSVVLLTSEILPYLGRIPKNVAGRPLVWLGANNLQPLEPDVAKFMGLESQAAIVVSEVLENSPAEKAGLRDRDIILSLNGQPLPRLKPDRAVVAYFERAVTRGAPGEVMEIRILRDNQNLTLGLTLEEAPELPRETPRNYFDYLGITIRGFTYADGAIRRVGLVLHRGVIAHFVRAGSPVAVAGLRDDDWIEEIDGTPLDDFIQARKMLAAIEADRARAGFMLGVIREGVAVELSVKLR